MFNYADTDREHIIRCLKHQILYDFHRDIVLVLDEKGRLHEGRLEEILNNPDITQALSHEALSALQEELRRNLGEA